MAKGTAGGHPCTERIRRCCRKIGLVRARPRLRLNATVPRHYAEFSSTCQHESGPLLEGSPTRPTLKHLASQGTRTPRSVTVLPAVRRGRPCRRRGRQSRVEVGERMAAPGWQETVGRNARKPTARILCAARGAGGSHRAEARVLRQLDRKAASAHRHLGPGDLFTRRLRSAPLARALPCGSGAKTGAQATPECLDAQEARRLDACMVHAGRLGCALLAHAAAHAASHGPLRAPGLLLNLFLPRAAIRLSH